MTTKLLTVLSYFHINSNWSGVSKVLLHANIKFNFKNYQLQKKKTNNEKVIIVDTFTVCKLRIVCVIQCKVYSDLQLII